MQFDILQTLDNRWPNDTVLLGDTNNTALLTGLITSHNNLSVYSDRLRLDEIDSKCIAAFGSAHGMTYTPRADVSVEFPDTADRAWPGHLLNTTAPMLAHKLEGNIHGYSIRTYLAYTASSVQTKGAETVRLVRRSVIRVALPKLFPQVVLESNKNDKSAVSTMPSSFKTSQRVDLEGDFKDYFDLYMHTGLQASTLTVLAPNFMEMLMQVSTKFDVEFYSNEMILITKDPLYTPTAIREATQLLETQLAYLDRLMLSWSYKPTKQPFDLLEKTYFKGEVVKIGSLRLSPGQLLAIIGASFALLVILSLIF